jgi:hypothetical protein
MKNTSKGSKTRLVSVGRNFVLKERFDSRTYELPSGRYIQVKTITEMEFVKRNPKRATLHSDTKMRSLSEDSLHDA